ITDTANNKAGPNTTIFGGGSGDLFNVLATHGRLTIDAGFGKETINVGSPTNPLLSTLDTILGPVTVNGQGGLTTLNINDQGSKTPHSYFLQNKNTLFRSPGNTAPISFFFMAPPNINKGPEIGKPPKIKNLKLTKSVKAGQPATLSGQLVDLNPSAKLTLVADWGDGSKPRSLKPGQAPFSLQHTFHKAGTYNVQVMWIDNGTGEFNTRELTITVQAKTGHGPKK